MDPSNPHFWCFVCKETPNLKPLYTLHAKSYVREYFDSWGGTPSDSGGQRLWAAEMSGLPLRRINPDNPSSPVSGGVNA